jgi:NAD-dependent dihydropyrimidine dehydrogenase PreA subunit
MLFIDRAKCNPAVPGWCDMVCRDRCEHHGLIFDGACCVHTDNCIGCGKCADSCTKGAISREPVHHDPDKTIAISEASEVM